MKPMLLAALLLLFNSINGQEKENEQPPYWAISIYYDQDYTLEQLGLKSLNEDRNYTMGLGFVVTSPRLKKSVLFQPQYLLNKLFNKRMLNDKRGADDRIINSIMLANGSFTPDSLPASYVIKNDRPYSSLTYLQTITSFIDQVRLEHLTATFSVGLLGTNISKVVQTAIHASMNDHDTKSPRTPRGWGNQISQGGELTIAYSSEKERLLTTRYVREELKTAVCGIELKHSWRYSLGYYTNVNYGFNFRAGRIDPRNWSYQVDPMGQSNKLVRNRHKSFDGTTKEGATENELNGYYDRPKTFEVYLFGSVRPTFMLYNALLNGQFHRSAHTLDFHDMRHAIAEFDGGGAVSIPFASGDLLEIKVRISGRSPEFKLDGRAARWHYWGGLDLVFSHDEGFTQRR